MEKYSDLIDALFCLSFGISSMTAGLWFYWNIVVI